MDWRSGIPADFKYQYMFAKSNLKSYEVESGLEISKELDVTFKIKAI